ncbi:MAG: phage tail protein [bacterium]
MSEPFLAEIRIVGFNFAPRGWALCDGQILPISQHQALYSLMGTIYGGDGRTSFALPDMRGRVPIHVGSSSGYSHPEGQKGGEERHALNMEEMPAHKHEMKATKDNASSTSPGNNVLARSGVNFYRDLTTPTTMNANAVTNTGVGQAHENMQPFLAVNFCIALQGIFPSPT